TDKQELTGIPSKKIMPAQKALKPYMEGRRAQESHGNYTWTLAKYGTPAMADEVCMSLEDYWTEIIKACYLDEDRPSGKWKALYTDLDAIKDKLDALPIDRLHIEADGTDLWIKIGPNRKWLGGSGRNIPS